MGESRRLAGIRRSAARSIVLILAGLAVAGTSPAPTRSPTLASTSEGFLELSTAQPMATVDVTVLANAALLAEPTNRTTVGIRRTSVTGTGQAQPLVLYGIQQLDAGGNPVVGFDASLSESINEVCQRTADCTRVYRITALLAGPADGQVKAGWRVVAETRTGTDEKPGSTPAGTVLSVTAARPVLAADRSVTASVTTDALRLDPAHPRFVRPITLVQPRGTGSMLLAGGLQWTITRDDGSSYPELVALHVESADGTDLSQNGRSGIQDVTLPECAEAAGCRTTLRVVGVWLGGPSTAGAAVTWTLGANQFTIDPTATVPASALALEPAAVAESHPEPVATTTGTFVIGGEKIKSADIEVAIDGRAIRGSNDGSGVFLQATMAATTRSRSGSVKQVLFNVDATSTSGPAGRDLSVVTGLIPVKCGGASCTAVIPLRAWVYGTPVDDVTLDWTLDLAVVLDEGIAIAAAPAVNFVVAPRP